MLTIISIFIAVYLVSAFILYKIGITLYRDPVKIFDGYICLNMVFIPFLNTFLVIIFSFGYLNDKIVEYWISETEEQRGKKRSERKRNRRKKQEEMGR